MKKGIKFVSLVIFSFLLLILSCQTAPQNELNAAKDALQKAQEAEADKYASDLFTQAQNSITEAENLIAQKKYSEAKTLLLDAKGVAESSISQAETNKENTKVEVEDFLAAIGDTANGAMKQLHETQGLAKQWKLPEAVWSLTEEMARWDEALKRAQAEYGSGNYYLAKQLAAGVHQEITQKDNQIRNMIMEKQGKGGK